MRSTVGRVARIRCLGALAAAALAATVAVQGSYQIRLKADATKVRLKADATYSRTPDTTSSQLPDVLLSRQLIAEAGVHVGDVVTLASDASGARAARFRVVGTYEPVPDPRKFSAKRLEARLHLPDEIALTRDPDDPGSEDLVTSLNLALVKPGEGDDVAAALARRIPGTAVVPTSRAATGDDPFAVLERFHEAIAMVTVTGSTAFLLALMVMRAEERREIIGILRLIGIPSRSILAEVLLEGLLIAIAGAIFGIVIATAAQRGVNRFFQWRYDTTLVFVRVTTSIAWEAVAFAVPLGVIAGLAASWTLLRRSVISLVRR